MEFWAAIVLDFAEVPESHVHVNVHLRSTRGLEPTYSGRKTGASSGRPPATSDRRRASPKTSGLEPEHDGSTGYTLAD